MGADSMAGDLGNRLISDGNTFAAIAGCNNFIYSRRFYSQIGNNVLIDFGPGILRIIAG